MSEPADCPSCGRSVGHSPACPTLEGYYEGVRHLGLMPDLIDRARDAAILAIDEYYNGDRAWAERWLLRAYEANQKEKAK